MVDALFQPLGEDDVLADRTRSGRSMRRVAEALIKPNDRLDSIERLQIYARCYWYRITECVYDDCPGLRALLGDERFAAFTRAYLSRHPSQTFTLRNLCGAVADFIREEPRWTEPHTELAHAIARFEWAQTQAFDAAALPPLTAEEIAQKPPTRLRVRLQPHLTLLAADWPVDDYVLKVKRREAQRAAASNAATGATAQPALPRVTRPRRRRTYLVVHRYQNRLFYRRETAAGFAILAALAQGRTLTRAIAAAGNAATPARLRRWFSDWMELGWLCPRRR